MTTRYVAYYRVSTVKQGLSGLGEDAQKAAVEDYVRRNDGETIATFTEIESGKKNDRPELAKALRHCRRSNATLIIAKLDRLARNVAFIANLMESNVEFVAVDFPKANKLTVHILAAVAEHEREMISTRTKDALAAKKARGAKLGGPLGAKPLEGKSGWRQSVKVRQKKADTWAQDQAELLENEVVAAAKSARQKAAALNSLGFRTRKQKNWTAQSVINLMQRLGLETPKRGKKNVVTTDPVIPNHNISTETVT